VQNHTILVYQLRSVVIAVIFNDSHDKPAVIPPILSVCGDGRFLAEFGGQFQYRSAETPVIFFLKPRPRFLGFTLCPFLALNSLVVLSDYRGGFGVEAQRFFRGVPFEPFMPCRSLSVCQEASKSEPLDCVENLLNITLFRKFFREFLFVFTEFLQFS
jgi:hypothetical protein